MIFKMPCLDKYDFDIEGNCWNTDGAKKTVIIKGNKQPYYYVSLDNNFASSITVREIIQYGKNLQQQSKATIRYANRNYIFYRPLLVTNRNDTFKF